MKSKVVNIVTELAEPIAQSLGLIIEEIEYVKKNTGMNLTIFISKEDGCVDLNDCEKLFKALDEPLDIADPTNGAPYIMNVSSLGLDRPLKTPRDFARNINKEIEVKLFSPINKKKEFIGTLIAFDDNSITLANNLTIDKKQIAICKPYIKF